MKIDSVIGVCGFGYSGSGAVLDLLKSYSEITVEDDLEFSLVYTPDGIEDLQRNIVQYPSRYWSSDSAIRRFIQLTNRKRKRFDQLTNGFFSGLLNDYLNNIIKVQWRGSTSVHVYQESPISYFFKQRLLRRLVAEFETRLKPLPWHITPQKEMYYSQMSDFDFVNYSRVFVMGILEHMVECNSGVLVLDQPYAANDPEKSFPFFNNPKAIIVTRDPRDTFLLANHNLGLMGSFVPTDDVMSFIGYYKGLMHSVKNNNTSKIITISFEDLIYKYDETKAKLISFVGCREESKKEKSTFNPEVSINNTQLWLKYTNHKEEIHRIEQHLNDYLYDFSVFEKKPKFNIASF